MRIATALADTAPTVIRTVQDGFDWGAAAAGAGAAIALGLIAVAVLAARTHRRKNPRRHT